MNSRKWMILGTALVLTASLVASCGDDDEDASGTPTAAAPSTTADALLEAINEEYKAHATYQAVIDKLGDVGPFPNIVKSEQSHIDAWKSMLTKYEIAVPADPFIGKVTAPATLQEACAAGAAAEKADVELYDRLMKTVTEKDILSVMEQQRKVSQENHLPAFERC